MTYFDAGPPMAAAWHVDGGQSTLTLARDLRHRPEAVWVALTDPNQLRQWAPFTADRDLATTASAVLRAADEIHAQDLPATVVRVTPPTLLEYTWGADRLTWALIPNRAGTRLTLRHTAEKAEWLPSIAAGWHLCLSAADRLLDGRPIGPIVGRKSKPHGWGRLHDAYATALGIPGTQWPDDLFPSG